MNRKNLLSIIISFCMMFCITTFQVGAVQIKDIQNDMIANEYLEIIHSSTDNDERIQKINLFKQHIYDLKDRYSAAELSQFGYNDKQIQAIVNYDGSEELSVAASATVTAIPSLISKTYNSSTNRTTVKVRVIFNINGILSALYKDYAALSITASNGNPFQPVTSAKADGNIEYMVLNDNGQIQYYIGGYSPSKSGDNGVDGSYEFNFPTRRDTYKIINSCYFTIESTVEGKPSFVTFRYAYGHSSISLATSIGITISGSPSIGITFTPKATVTLYPSSSDNRSHVFDI